MGLNYSNKSEKTPRTWVWISTPETVENECISVLACLETIFACSLALWVGIHYNFWWHIAIGVCIGFFLLLRTPYSTYLGLKSLQHQEVVLDTILLDIERTVTRDMETRNADHKELRHASDLRVRQFFSIILFYFSSSYLCIFIRISVTFMNIIKNPINTILSIPKNSGKGSDQAKLLVKKKKASKMWSFMTLNTLFLYKKSIYKLGLKAHARKVVESNDMYELKEPIVPYNAHLHTESDLLRPKNMYYWKENIIYTTG